MRLKHVLFSSLFLSAAFVACTNEDFIEEGIKGADTSAAISLGEGFTIKVENAGAETKGIFGFGEDEAVNFAWEETDKIGAAWYNMVPRKDGFEILEDGSAVVKETATLGDAAEFFSNHPFAFAGGTATKADFVCNTEAFAGAYVLYYPFKSVTAGYYGVDFALSDQQTFNTQEPLAAITENAQVWGAAKLVPGGVQTNEFKLHAVPVLYKLYFTATKKLNHVLGDGITIQKIVLIAKDKDGNNILTTKGAVNPIEGVTVTPDHYNEENGKDLSQTVAYAGDENAIVDHYSVTVKNGNAGDYKMKAVDVPTVEPFYFNTLPFTGKVAQITVKAVTNKGTFFKTYGTTDVQLTNEEQGFVQAENEGGFVHVNVKLDVTELDGVIYMADEFVSEWNRAAVSSNPVEELKVGENLDLSGATEGLVLNNINKTIKVVYEGANKDNTTDHEIKVPALNIVAGNVEFENTLTVAGAIDVSASGDLKADVINAESMKVANESNIEYGTLGSLYVVTAGNVTIAPADDTSSTIGEIYVEKTNNRVGKLTVEGATLQTVTNNGTIVLKGGSLKAGETFTNNGEVELTTDFTNNGTFVQNGELNPGTATFTNAAGATLNINGAGKLKLVNNGKSNNKEAAVVNVKLPTAGSENNADGDWLIVAEGTTNAGIINLLNGSVGTEEKNAIQSDDAARIKVSDGGFLSWYGTNVTGGYVELSKNAKVYENQTNGLAGEEQVVAAMDNNTALANINAQAGTLLVGTLTINSDNAATLQSKHLVLTGNINLAEDFTMGEGKDLTVAESLTISTTAEKGAELKLRGGDQRNVIKSGAVLTLAENVKLGNGNTNSTPNPNLVVEAGAGYKGAESGAFSNVNIVNR